MKVYTLLVLSSVRLGFCEYGFLYQICQKIRRARPCQRQVCPPARL